MEGSYYWVILVLILCIIVLSGALIWYLRYCRRQPRYDYSALEDEALLQDRLEMDRKLHRDASRNMAMIHCQYYLRGSSRYVFMRQLADMGSRTGKHWFLVSDTATKTERLLTMTRVAENCPVRYTAATRPVLLELLLALQHPYIYPVLDIDRKIITEQEFVISVIPFNETGTLKDLIYSSHCQDEWSKKYQHQGYGLQQSQIQRLGCQILEALIFLKDQHFPPFVHLHTGNVILQNGVARVSGLENVLLGYPSRNYLLIPRKVYENKEAAEIICFGHLLFEMATACELHMSHPNEKSYTQLDNYPLVVEVLRFIFEQGRNRYPSLRQVASLELFRHIDLRELQSHVPIPVFRANLSQEARCLLREIRRHHRIRKKKRSQSLSTLETASIDSRDSSESSSKVAKKKKKRVLSSSETTPDQLCTQMQTLPLSDIEGSTSVTVSYNNKRDKKGHCSTVVTAEQNKAQGSLHSMLLKEIQSGFHLKRYSQDQNVDV